jgi:predicted Zn-dependent protease
MGRLIKKNHKNNKIFFVFIYVMVLALFSYSLKNAYAMMSVEEERKFGEKLLKDVKHQVKLVNESEIDNYVKKIGEKILRQVDVKYFDFNFFVIEDPALNAFAMPGGNIFIHSGILEYIDSEDDLACVIAHEIGHIQARHIAKRLATMQKLNIATIALAVTGLFLGGSGQGSQAAIAGSTALAMSATLKYSRTDEEEADRRAFEWVCKAGYNPQGLINVMKKIIQNRWIGSDSIPGYLSTHPSSSERITYLEQLIAFKPCKFTPHDNEEIKRIKAMAATLGKDPIDLIKYYKQETSKKPDDIYLQYSLALSYMQNRQFNEAIARLEEICKKVKNNHPFYIDIAKAYFFSGDYKKTISLLSGIKVNPFMQTTVDYLIASSLLETGETYNAITLFKKLIDNWADPSELYLKLGRAYAKITKNGEAHYFFYKHYKEIDDPENQRYHRKKAMELLDKQSEMYKELAEDNENEKEKKKKHDETKENEKNRE